MISISLQVEVAVRAGRKVAAFPRPDLWLALKSMTEQEKKLAKKIGRPATGRGRTIGVRLHDPEIAALDAWMEANGHAKRAGAVRAILKEKLGV